MSNSDSFIEEVSEELRRDRLFKMMRRYGWIVVLVLVALVGGAAFNEYRKAQNAQAARAAGDQIITAFQADQAQARAQALQGVQTETNADVIVQLLLADAHLENDDRDAALAIYNAVRADDENADIYRDLASFKALLLQEDTLSFDERRAGFATLSAPGGAFRLLAEEQLAFLEIEDGQTDAALLRLQQILSDNTITPGLQRRVSQLIISLGGELEAT
ncbi:tetratricopeptide repeat protein [Pseudaestuariivita rosea]|uniref:tetratricopeptide repeat protein n=1 Tax=Pseudaestuariivita rosea TaxID=2763263 RepID=UPI001ABA205B|nr:tetratricopeptide repeat protein [Pseudaestuariivita rosea]